MHTLFVPLIFFLAFVFGFINSCFECKKEKKLNLKFFNDFFRKFLHLILDFFGSIMLFYPISKYSVGLNLFGYLPFALERLAALCFNAGLLIIWFLYMEKKYKISDFI